MTRAPGLEKDRKARDVGGIVDGPTRDRDPSKDGREL